MPFHSPPNWPAPPAGWQPGPDWSPSPSWPPAPAGWVFWSDDASPGTQSTPPEVRGDVDGRSESAASISTDGLRDSKATIFQRFSAWSARPYRADGRPRWMAVRVVNPMRVAYGMAAVGGFVLFVWQFVEVRFGGAWNEQGWLWRGVWPVVVMLIGLAVGLAGVGGVRRWNSVRWQARGAR